MGLMFGLLASVLLAPPEPAVVLPADDAVRIAEARRIVDRYPDLWTGWAESPFAVLLVTPGTEFLVFHPHPSADFVRPLHDATLDATVRQRDRIFDKNLLATFPAIGGVPTIVIGQPKNTEASHSTRWVLTLVHEHFHQWQQSQPDYYAATEALGLAGADTTGMWMLNYPFPYDSARANEAFDTMCRSLGEALGAVNEPGFRAKVADYRKARNSLKALLGTDDYAYFSFQVWQEGIARYTEIRIASQFGNATRPSKRLRELPDYVPFDEVADEIRNNVLANLLGASLKRQRRTAFYHVGAAEGLLLDELAPGWQGRYMTDKFFVEKYYPE